MAMFVLGIESSCDETAAAVIEFDRGGWRILADEISSQSAIHEEYGGVVPELAARAHLTNLPLVVDKVLRDSAVRISQLAAIGATRGPGLKGCLLMGLGFAKGAALACSASLVGVNHIEAHIHAAQLDNPALCYPYLALVVSGGHTEIVQVLGLGSYKIAARTGDDAAGEAFDKSANLLGFPYPGGAALAALADNCRTSPYKLPRVMREAEGFSFSGLKTAIALLIRREREKIEREPETRAALAGAIQEAIVDALCFKLEQAVKQTGICTIAVTGGVAANQCLRRRVAGIRGCRIYFPQLKHCMDNGAMVAFVAGLRTMAGQRDSLDLPALARWPVEEINSSAS